jgi:hypothetical protein
MAARVQIQCINKTNRYDPHDAIDNFGGVNADGTRWKQTLREMVGLIEAGKFSFYVSVGGRSVDVIISTSAAGHKYLKTTADGAMPNNLLSLPECPK